MDGSWSSIAGLADRAQEVTLGRNFYRGWRRRYYMELLRLDEKSVVITGGGSGIGRSIATLFAERGATVHVIDVNETEATTLIDEIRSRGGRAHAHICDISKSANVDRVFKGIREISQSVDVLVNNAGIPHVGTLASTSEEDFERLFQVNVKGAFLCSKAAIADMLENGEGVILNVSSIAAVIGISDRFAYTMTKGAIQSMTFSIAKDYVHKNIRCNCICPARVHTPFVDGYLAKNYAGKEAEMFKKLSDYQPVGRMASPKEVATLALYLCSDEAQFITGAAYPIDGGVLALR